MTKTDEADELETKERLASFLEGLQLNGSPNKQCNAVYIASKLSTENSLKGIDERYDFNYDGKEFITSSNLKSTISKMSEPHPTGIVTKYSPHKHCKHCCDEKYYETETKIGEVLAEYWDWRKPLYIPKLAGRLYEKENNKVEGLNDYGSIEGKKDLDETLDEIEVKINEVIKN